MDPSFDLIWDLEGVYNKFGFHRHSRNKDWKIIQKDGLENILYMYVWIGKARNLHQGLNKGKN